MEKSAGGPESLAAAAKLLSEAKNPIILAGGGVVMANAIPEVKALAEVKMSNGNKIVNK